MLFSTVLVRYSVTRAAPFFAAAALWLVTPGARAADFYVEPETGSVDGVGTESAPWRTLEEVAAAGHFGSTIQAGDSVWLGTGYHGDVNLAGGEYATPITVSGAPGATPRLRRLTFSATHGWVVRGLTISPSFASPLDALVMVEVNGDASDIVIEDSTLFSVEDASSWGANEWIELASSGIDVSGDRVTVRNNLVQNVRFGISASGLDARVENNRVVNFSADGLRGLGDNGVFEYNLVKNSYVDGDLDANHDDGFQSWSTGPGGPGSGEVRGVVLRGNVIINWEDPAQPLRTSLQGIGCFDGFFVGWVVENNVVITDHWHGISFLGMRDSRIVNNTVIDVNDVDPGPPWIMVAPHKDGRVSENVIVRNNLATDYSLEGTSVVDDHNLELLTLSEFFVDPTGFDLHLLPGAPAVDVGNAELAPAFDLDRIPRPQGAGVDLGAYEWHDPSVVPQGGAASGGAGGTPAAGAGGTTGSGAVSPVAGAVGSGATAPGGDGGTAAAGARTATGGRTAGGASPELGGAAGAASPGAGGDSDAGCGCAVPSGGPRASLLSLLALVVAGMSGRRRGVRNRRRGTGH